MVEDTGSHEFGDGQHGVLKELANVITPPVRARHLGSAALTGAAQFSRLSQWPPHERHAAAPMRRQPFVREVLMPEDAKGVDPRLFKSNVDTTYTHGCKLGAKRLRVEDRALPKACTRNFMAHMPPGTPLARSAPAEAINIHQRHPAHRWPLRSAHF